MKSLITCLLLLNLLVELNAQNKNEDLTTQTFIYHLDTVCEETPEPVPCAGFEIYFIMTFDKEDVTIIEKHIDSCESEYIASKLNYRWILTPDSQIKIFSNPIEIKYNFLKDLVLKIENKNLIGYKLSKTLDFGEFNIK